MKNIFIVAIFCLFAQFGFTQVAKEEITKVCLHYIEGFYEGDTVKLIKSLKPSLYKFGYWKDKNSGKYAPDEYMTYRQALDYAKNVLEKKHFAKAGAPKKVEILDIQNTIAAAKVTAWWGVDYILLSKQDDQWMVEQVLWEGPLLK